MKCEYEIKDIFKVPYRENMQINEGCFFINNSVENKTKSKKFQDWETHAILCSTSNFTYIGQRVKTWITT